MDILNRSKGKCGKANPATCRLHGKAVREKQELERSVRIAAREKREKEMQAAFTVQAIEDFKESWKLKTESDGTTTVSVYRSGKPSAPVERGVEKPYYERCDSHLPDARQGRMTGVFCSPTIGGAARWVRGNYLSNNKDVEVREIRIDVDTTYVYLVHDWERASSNDTPEMYQRYWRNGMTMREYMTVAQQEPHKYDPREFELLVPEQEIRVVKPVSPKRLIGRAYDNQDDLQGIYKNLAKEKRRAREQAVLV